ncbi:MAG: TasA family protein [Candidatus Omnitrophota bacterium]|nr:TasA family protein [Candidatus Omnitrophota bacterium]
MKWTNHKKRIFRRIGKSLGKIGIFAGVICFAFYGMSILGGTNSYFNDTATVNGSIFQAGTLDLTVRSGQGNFVPQDKVSNMKPGDTVARDIYIKKEGDLPFKYNAKSEPVGGLCDTGLYNALQLKIWYNYYTETPQQPNYNEHRIMTLKYDGLLKDFNLRALSPDDLDLQIPNSHPYFNNIFYGPDEHWFYSSQIILPAAVSAELQNKTCQFKFVFNGWQINLPDSSSGFTDTEEILSTITTGNWLPDVTVTYPDGGQVWYLVPESPAWSSWCLAHGMNADCKYPIRWTAANKIGPDTDLLIDIYFSTDSGVTWLAQQIADDISNTGEYWWRIPYDAAYITDQARIKVEATHKDYSFLTNWDMSDIDFCPPMMTFDDLLNWQGPAEGSTVTELTTTDVITTIDTEATTTEEIPTTTIEEQTGGGIIEEINEIINEMIDGIVDEIVPGEIINEPVKEAPAEETVEEPEASVIEDVSIIEEASGEEENNEEVIINEPVVNEPAIEEEPVVVSENPESNNSNPEEGGDASINEGSGDTTETPAE